MATIDLTGIWQEAKDTREAKNEVNRPGYSKKSAASASTMSTRTVKKTS